MPTPDTDLLYGYSGTSRNSPNVVSWRKLNQRPFLQTPDPGQNTAEGAFTVAELVENHIGKT